MARVHVVADFGTTVASELEVFAFIARANDDMRAFSLLAMVVSLFETGYLRAGAGLFEAFPGNLSAEAGMAVRVTDAMRRGAAVPRRGHRLRQHRLPAGRLVRAGAAAGRGGPAPVPRATEVGRGGGRRLDRAVGAGRHQPVPAGRRPELAEAQGRPYEAYGADVA